MCPSLYNYDQFINEMEVKSYGRRLEKNVIKGKFYEVDEELKKNEYR